MITVVVIVNVMVLMINMVVCGQPPVKPVHDNNCHLYDEIELAKGLHNCPFGRQREYTAKYRLS